jgi:hypothetical protein
LFRACLGKKIVLLGFVFKSEYGTNPKRFQVVGGWGVLQLQQGGGREGGRERGLLGTELNPAHQFCKETVSFLSFPYVSPEPVLVKSLNHPFYI